MRLLVLLVVFLSIPVLSCKKESLPHVCAACIEKKSGYQPADYCGLGPDVDAYVKTLKEEGAKKGQTWECEVN